MVSAAMAGAQQPVVVVPPLRGHVTTPGGNPVPDAEVRVEGGKAIVRTDAQGLFTIPDISKGIITVTVRHIGYLPATASVEFPAMNDSLTVQLVPTHTELDTVKVTAQLKVLGGIVVNEHNNPIEGAKVDLIGNRRNTVTTGPDGWFTFTNVKPGPVVFRVLKEGFVANTQSVTLSDWRGVVVHMTAIDPTLSKAKQEIAAGFGNTAQYVWTETQQRLLQRNMQAVVVTSEELAPFTDMTLGEAVTHTRSAAALMPDMSAANNQVCVLLNGSRVVGMTSLDIYNTEDIEFVEIYPPGAEASGTVARYMRFAGCTGGRSITTGRRGIYYAVVWLKS
jgi:hypothetical protein